MRKGNLTQADREFIASNLNSMSPQEIADKLDRPLHSIEKVISVLAAQLPKAESAAARWHLKHSMHWKQLKEEFDENELNYIEDQYIKYVDQFKQDIVATEEVQILDLIKIEVLQQRNLKGKQKINENIRRYEQMCQSTLDTVDGNFGKLEDSDKERIMEMRKNIQAALQAESVRTVEYVSLQQEHNKLAEKVMGSRDQRVKEIMNSKVSWHGHIKKLLERDKQINDSRFLELNKLGAEREFERLSEPHIYADKTTDNPILSAEVVEKFANLGKLLQEQPSVTPEPVI